MAAESSAETPARRWSLVALRHTLWRIIVATVGTCLRYRVTGLAAEAAFFAVLSLPPLIFALAGSIGYVFAQLDNSQIDDVRHTVLDLASRALTPETVDKIIRPTLNDVLRGGRYDVISIGFVLALWSGSRALNVFVDTITIMYGLGGHRGIVRTRALSFLLYVLGMLTGVVTIPLVVAGPRVVARALPDRLDLLSHLYWPTVVLLCVCFLTTLYHVSVPVRTAWRYNLPGAVFSMFCWIGRAPLGAGRHGPALHLDLRPAGRADRGPALALHPLHCGTHRCRTQRRLRPALAAEGGHQGPLRAAPAAEPRHRAAVAGSA
jgi:membrane protein